MNRSSTRSSEFDLRMNFNHPEQVLPPILVIYTCFKILLMPTYRSTDFDVHRNWLAITHNLPISQWYFDDVNGTTVHTLDYPPLFAFFEAALSNNPLTAALLPENDRCLDLLPDNDNSPSGECVVFHRSTVILSDIVLWIGAYMACRAMYHGKPLHLSTTSFLLIILNPGLLWLDHIHFQYNGMLLGILLGSLGLLMQGNNVPAKSWAYDLCHLGGAALFAILLNFKHLYLTLAPLYFSYLLERYCFSDGKKFLFGKFTMLATVTGFFLVAPWIPFLIQEDPKAQLLQIVARLFPFGRGLVHDYWAANIWALYLLADKVVRLVVSLIPWVPFSGLPQPTPMICALSMFVCQIPALQVASARKTNVKLIQAVVYCSFCSFMLAYHVHEKAIMTALIPLTLLVCETHLRNLHALIFWQVSLWGLLGLFPLFSSSTELPFKFVSYVAYLAFCTFLSKSPFGDFRQLCAILAGAVVIVLEVLPVQGRFEFLPLMITSTVCALGLIGSWFFMFGILVEVDSKKKRITSK
jgi:alpha-1,3-glucosyltransferase